VFASLTKQGGVKFEMDSSVPAYKLDVFLANLTMKNALERVLKASGMKHELTDRATVRVFKPEQTDANRVTISHP
jgi:hypothetical protein